MSTPVTSADSGENLDQEEMNRRIQAETFAAFGEGFEPAFDFTNTHERVQQALGSPRRDIPPEAINAWECRIGGSKFFVPPININVSSVFKSGNMTGAAIRQQSAPKFNSGHTETVVEMTLYFASYEEIFGFEDEIFRINFDSAEQDLSQYHPSDRSLLARAPAASDDDETIDKFMSSLRGLIAQFKYAPFLPVRNVYLNRVFGITGVVLKDMSISNIPGYPFCMAVNLTMYKFNHKVYLPMIEHFDQAIHWGRFRQYMGRAAGRLAQSARPIQEFAFSNQPDGGVIRPSVRSPQEILNEVSVEDVPSTQTYRRHTQFESNKLEFWYPVSTPARVDLPDLSDMRYDDIVFSQQRKNWWQRFLGVLGFDVNTNRDQYQEAIKMAEEQGTGFISNTNEFKLLSNYLQRMRMAADVMDQSALNRYYNERLAEEGVSPGTAQAREMRVRIQSAWFYAMYKFFMEDPTFARAVAMQDRRGRQLSINEWEVPMTPRNLDMDTVKIQGVSVTMGNVIARLQLQMQDEPTHQHIGGADTVVSIAMRIQGENAEDELVKLRTMFDHIAGLARLEHAHGVLGFLGIKNVITELVGVRYVIPLNFEVNTVPGFPHVYDVHLTLTDFDIFQQKRESLSAEQQAELVDAFGKRNPFFRIKQMWGMFNAYPDFPLSVRDAQGKIVGHLDPDYYFRSFKSLDDDLFLSEESRKLANIEPSQGADAIRKAVEEIDRETREDLQRKQNPSYNFMEAPGVHFCVGMGEGGSREYCTIDDHGFSLYSDNEPFLVNAHFNEPHAGNMIDQPDEEVPDFTPPAGYMQPYLDNSGDPWMQFEAMSQDMLYRDVSGRMIRAYPTYMLWLIDEGGTFAGMKLFDNFYGLQSVIDMSIVQSEDILGDTLVLRVSNLYSKLSQRFNDILDETNPGTRIINQMTRRLHRTLSQSGYIVDLETMQLRPGIRLHLRLGYGANPNRLQTVFNGTITEVHTGEIVTIVAQSDAMELSAMVNSTNEKGHTGKIDGGMVGLYMSEPRDLMITLLTQGSTKVKEVIAHATQGEVFSENRYGIRHFGTMFYEPLDGQERTKAGDNANRMSTIMHETHEKGLIETSGGRQRHPAEMAGITSMAMLDVMNAAWVNLAAKRDYEVFKRNIYPGNGTGIGQFHGGDLGEYGLSMAIDNTESMRPNTSGEFTVSGGGQAAIDAAVQLQETADDDVQSAWARAGNRTATAVGLGMGAINPGVLAGTTPSGNRRSMSRAHNLASIFGITRRTDEDDGIFDEVAFRAQTYLKSVWDLFLVCAALLPDYIVAVRPFEDRSTVFYGKPHWLYTSGLTPLTTGLPPEAGPGYEAPDQEMIEIFDNIEKTMQENDQLRDFDEMFAEIGDYQPNRSDPTSSTGGMQFSGDASGADLAARAALAAGFPRDEAITMVAIAGAESNWTADINNAGMNRDGTTDYGMWQINKGAHGNWVDFSRISDPFYNAEVAFELVRRKKAAGNSRIFGDWAVHDHYAIANAARGKYKQYLEPARLAVENALSNASNTSQLSQADQASAARYTAAAEHHYRTTGQDPKKDDDGRIDGIPADTDGQSDRDAEIAAEVYNWQGKGRTDKEAEEIWDEVRQFFPTDGETERVFMRARQFENLEGSQREVIWGDIGEDVINGFLAFMENNPYSYGWVVRTANRRAGGFLLRAPERLAARAIDAVTGIFTFGRGTNLTAEADRKWDFGPMMQCFAQYISYGDKAAIEFMKTNHGQGRDHANIVLRAFEEVGAGLHKVYEGVKDAVMKPFQAIGGVATGLISFMRLTMMQLTNGLSMATNMQRQTNQLNRAFNDSMYYSAGRDPETGEIVNPMLYYADNPFTREYAEPVVEIREPFQRLHTLGSFQHILDNSIIETTDGVATVVTATSNGQHPVTVHFDKGAPAEKQTEMIVDTGLFYDHPKGWFGLKKIVKPIESMRWMTMGGSNANMETTAKRVALWHLKRSLQDIYQGQLTIIGDSTIRPHDLVYLGDVYERMYGFFEVEEVVHHFTPETGFISTIKPNACVSINDPARFMMISRMRGQSDIASLRNHMREQLQVYADDERTVEGLSGGEATTVDGMIEQVVDQAEIQVRNSLQYAGGNTALVKSIAGMGGGGGIIAGGGAAALGASTAVSGGFAAVGGILGWKAWKWVRDNLLDQQGCYIQYLTKNGRPMDAGLSYNAGVAVGQQHVRSIVFKGLKLGELPVVGRSGSTKIRTQDVIPLIQWDETGPNEHAQEVSLFVDRTNAEVRRIAGREGLPGGFDQEVYWVRITRITDGDTFYITVLGQMKYGEFSPGRFVLGDGRVRPAGVDAPEDMFKTRSAAERAVHMDDPGVRATEFARSILMPGGQGLEVALRIDKANRMDQFDRTLAYVFHRAPENMHGDERRDFILNAASRTPPISYDSYMEDGQPYTFDWEMIAAGHGKVFTNDMKRNQTGQGVTGGG